LKRIRQIVVALVGLFYTCLLYPLCAELWHSKWLLEMHDNECEPMFITFLVALAWIIHEVSSQKRKDALKGLMNTGFRHPAFPFGASIA
jgi:hypothetical protein